MLAADDDSIREISAIRAHLAEAVLSTPFGDAPDTSAPPFAARQLIGWIDTKAVPAQASEGSPSHLRQIAAHTLEYLWTSSRAGVDGTLRSLEPQVQRLQRAEWAHLNGALGVAASFNAGTGRYNVQLARSPKLKGEDVVALPREALLRLQNAPPAVRLRQPLL